MLLLLVPSCSLVSCSCCPRRAPKTAPAPALVDLSAPAPGPAPGSAPGPGPARLSPSGVRLRLRIRAPRPFVFLSLFCICIYACVVVLLVYVPFPGSTSSDDDPGGHRRLLSFQEDGTVNCSDVVGLGEDEERAPESFSDPESSTASSLPSVNPSPGPLPGYLLPNAPYMETLWSGAVLLTVAVVVLVLGALGLVSCLVGQHRAAPGVMGGQPPHSTLPMLAVHSGMDRLRVEVGLGSTRQRPPGRSERERAAAVGAAAGAGSGTDRAVRLVADLPPNIPLPDGEEFPYGSSTRLHIRDPQQESEIHQKCIRPPPNKTVFDGESPPSYRSSPCQSSRYHRRLPAVIAPVPVPAKAPVPAPARGCASDRKSSRTVPLFLRTPTPCHPGQGEAKHSTAAPVPATATASQEDRVSSCRTAQSGLATDAQRQYCPQCSAGVGVGSGSGPAPTPTRHEGVQQANSGCLCSTVSSDIPRQQLDSLTMVPCLTESRSGSLGTREAPSKPPSAPV